MMLGEPVLIGRGRDGVAFAMRDICPHRGVPLSAGRVLADNTVECPYHGWRFRGDGVCAAIPSLVGGETIEASNIRVKSYPVREQDGLIWVYMRRPAARLWPHAPSRRASACPTPNRAGTRASSSIAASTTP